MNLADVKQLIWQYCKKGDEEAFNCFYREQSAILWRFLIARGCDRELAYDLLAEAFTHFIQVICRDPSSPKALLYRIAINLHIDHLRKQRSRKEIQNPLAITGDDADLEQLVHVRQILATLQETEQNLLLMRYWVGMTYREIAQVLNKPEGTVRRQSAELLNSLQQHWGAET